MRRSPFKTFFALSLGVIVFFFLARVFVTAFILAAVMSLIFFVFRKIKNFFKYMAWDEEFDYRNDYQSGREIPRWERREAPIFKSRENRYDEQVIVI